MQRSEDKTSPTLEETKSSEDATLAITGWLSNLREHYLPTQGEKDAFDDVMDAWFGSGKTSFEKLVEKFASPVEFNELTEQFQVSKVRSPKLDLPIYGKRITPDNKEEHFFILYNEAAVNYFIEQVNARNIPANVAITIHPQSEINAYALAMTNLILAISATNLYVRELNVWAYDNFSSAQVLQFLDGFSENTSITIFEMTLDKHNTDRQVIEKLAELIQKCNSIKEYQLTLVDHALAAEDFTKLLDLMGKQVDCDKNTQYKLQSRKQDEKLPIIWLNVSDEIFDRFVASRKKVEVAQAEYGTAAILFDPWKKMWQELASRSGSPDTAPAANVVLGKGPGSP